MRQRKSSIERIKVIAIIAIVICHSIPGLRVEYHYATQDRWLWAISVLKQLGSVGNALFLVSSSWFLVDKSEVDIKKIKNILVDNWLISMLFLFIFLFFYSIDKMDILREMFPFCFATLWYITCYVIYYSLHGIINGVLKQLIRRPKRTILMVLLFIVFQFAIGFKYYNDLIGFFLIHILTYCVKNGWNYARKEVGFAKIITIVGFFFWIGGAYCFNAIGCRLIFVGQRYSMWNTFLNPFIIMMSYGLIIIADNETYYNRIINDLSRKSLYVYMITGNQLVRIYFDNDIYDRLVGGVFEKSYEYCFWFTLGYAFLKSVFGFGFATLYLKIKELLKVRVRGNTVWL